MQSEHEILSAQIEDLLHSYFERPEVRGKMRALRLAFEQEGVAFIPDFAPGMLRSAVTAEARYLLEHYSRRRELNPEATGNTPRFYSNVSRNVILQNGQFIPLFFRSEAFTNFIAEVVNVPKIFPAPYEPEEFVISSMSEVNDTYGWHWDDYSYAVTWVIEQPPADHGAHVQYISNTRWDKNASLLEHYLNTHPLITRYLSAGTLYLIKGDTTLHRVSPLDRAGRRVVLVLSYAAEKELRQEVSHETP
jgi:hypothetical protein